MVRRLNKFLNLPHADKALLLYTFLLVLAIRVALWILPFRLVRRLVAQHAKPASRLPSSPANSADVFVRAIRAVSRMVPAATCLTQALAAELLLARAGRSPTLRIGVTKVAGKLKAHAWVECGRQIVMGELPELSEFQPLPAV